MNPVISPYVVELAKEAFSKTKSSEFGFMFNVGKHLKKEHPSENVFILDILTLKPEMLFPYWWYYRNHNEKMIERYGRYPKDVEMKDLESPDLFLDAFTEIFDQFNKLNHPDIENEHLFLRIICEDEGELMIFRAPKKNLPDDHYKDGHKFDLTGFKWDAKEAPQELLNIRTENPDKGQYISIQFFLPRKCPKHIKDLAPKE